MRDHEHDDGDPFGPWYYAYRTPRVRIVAGALMIVFGLVWCGITRAVFNLGGSSLLLGGFVLYWGLFTSQPKRHEWDD